MLTHLKTQTEELHFHSQDTQSNPRHVFCGKCANGVDGVGDQHGLLYELLIRVRIHNWQIIPFSDAATFDTFCHTSTVSGIRRLVPFYKSQKLRASSGSLAILGGFRFSRGAVDYVGVMLVVEKERERREQISRHGSSL